MSSNLNMGNFATNQSQPGPAPNTLASAATLAPSSLITYVTGTVQVANVTPPLDGQHMLVLVFTNASPGVFLTSGNIVKAFTPVINVPVLMFYDPALGKYLAK